MKFFEKKGDYMNILLNIVSNMKQINIFANM